MTVDQIVSMLNNLASTMLFLSHVVPGGATYLAAAAAAVSALAANRDLVQQAFDGVTSLATFAATVVSWLEANGHPLAAKYLLTGAE